MEWSWNYHAIHGTIMEHDGIITELFKLWWNCYNMNMELSWNYCGLIMDFLWNYHGIIIIIVEPLNCNGGMIKELLWN